MRVHELAKDLGVTSKEIIAMLGDVGVVAKSHMSTIDDTAIELLREDKKKTSNKIISDKVLDTIEVENSEESLEIKKDTTESKISESESSAVVGKKEQEGGNIIRVKGAIIVKSFADSLGIRPNKLIAELMQMNIFASITERLEVNIAGTIAKKHGFILEHEKRTAEHRQVIKKQVVEEEEEDKPEDLVKRSPVITFLGHVDHGKTSLLDRIRNTSIVNGEHGGITQHIGAYTIDVKGHSITLLDTPGHAAFTAMRARGANLTDIAIIVIAADDGIMPQTKEAIMHAQAANVALIVAINKIDLPSANLDRVMRQLQAEGLVPEDWGGDTICVKVSAHTGEGMDHLLEMVLLQAEIMELKANPKRRALGYVIESQLEPGMGPTANLLVTNGTLKIGDSIICNQYYGRVKALINDRGIKIKEASPSTPVKCLGLSGVPDAGTSFRVLSNDKIAKNMATQVALYLKDEQKIIPKKASLDDLFGQIQDIEKLELKLIIKADTQGSVEAIIYSLNEIKSDKICIKIVLSGTGNITVNDVMLASATNTIILGFHIAKEPGVDSVAKREGVEIRLHYIIYELIDQVRDALKGMLAPEFKENIIGHAEVRQTFSIGKTGNIAGCLLLDGYVNVKSRVRVTRKSEVLFEGGIQTLKHYQDNVSEVKEAQEFGVRLHNFADFKSGDTFEFYNLEELERAL